MTAEYQFTRVLADRFEATFLFYRDVMGFTPVFGTQHDTYADFDLGTFHISLFDRAEMAAALGTSGLPVSAPAQDGVCLVFEVADVRAEAARLTSLGVPLVADVTDHPDWVITTLHLRDPEGTLLELNQPLP